MNIKDYLKTKKLICDGAFGTYFQSLNDEIMPEKANTTNSELVTKIHREYIRSGARLIRTNTFASNKSALNCNSAELKENLKAAFFAAQKAIDEENLTDECFIAGDIGPLKSDITAEYIEIAECFIGSGAKIILFETFSDVKPLVPVVNYINEKYKDVFIITQFCLNQHGYTQRGISAKRLAESCLEIDAISAFGFNCGIGPEHLKKIMRTLNLGTEKYITAMPNSSYPTVIKNRMVFTENTDYFGDVMVNVSEFADIVGGCCGTTPKYIKKVADEISLAVRTEPVNVNSDSKADNIEIKDNIFFGGKQEGKKIVAVELDPPKNGDCTLLMETANMLKQYDVDVITFADSPSGRTRADSVLMSIKVQQEVGINVMPHICCRDKNAIGMNSLMLGAYINGIRNMLVITGDPVPSSSRENVKSVFNFDSVKLMEYINRINEENFTNDKICYGGAINYSRKNIDVEIKRALKKQEAGARFFFTQPVYCDEDIETLRYIKTKLNAKIMIGVMPLVSYTNALFIKNEISGINVPDDVLSRFSKEMTKEEGRAVGIEISSEIISKTADFDGYYFTIPFNRLSTAKALLDLINK